MTVETTSREPYSWQAPPWATETDTSGDAIADFCHRAGKVASVPVMLRQSDELMQDDAGLAISRTAPFVLVAGERLTVDEVRELSRLLTSAAETLDQPTR